MYNFQKTISDIRIVIHTDLHVDVYPPLVEENVSPEKRTQYSVTYDSVGVQHLRREGERKMTVS